MERPNTRMLTVPPLYMVDDLTRLMKKSNLARSIMKVIIHQDKNRKIHTAKALSKELDLNGFGRFRDEDVADVLKDFQRLGCGVVVFKKKRKELAEMKWHGIAKIHAGISLGLISYAEEEKWVRGL